jgi:hypothetical protein
MFGEKKKTDWATEQMAEPQIGHSAISARELNVPEKPAEIKSSVTYATRRSRVSREQNESEKSKVSCERLSSQPRAVPGIEATFWQRA